MDPRLLKIEIRWFDRQIKRRSFLSCVCAFYPRSATYLTMISDVYVCLCRVLHFIVSEFSKLMDWFSVWCVMCAMLSILSQYELLTTGQLSSHLISYLFFLMPLCASVAVKMDIWAAEINNTWHENYSTYCPLYSLSVCLLMYPSIDCRK